MSWIIVAVLAIGSLAGLLAACLMSTPRRPETDATYAGRAMLAAGAVSGAAVCAIAAAVLAASA
ncbi:hypothetical protein GCM10027289_21290 [Tsukamurella serpentis]